jgi:CRISPR-associated protein Csb2
MVCSAGFDNAGSHQWVSLTPFIPPRHLKKSGRHDLAGQVTAELASRGFPTADVEMMPERSRALRHFLRKRGRHAAPPPQDVGFALRLTFAEPISGPLALGYASHFGMGLFVVADGDATPA